MNQHHILWEGVPTPEVRAFIERGNGPWWMEGDQLVISQDPEGSDNLRVRPGEWFTWLGGEPGFELGIVLPVYVRVGWDDSEWLVGWIMDAADMPGLLRKAADEWDAEEEEAK